MHSGVNTAPLKVIASKDKNTLPTSQTTTSTTEENVSPQPPQGGLVVIAASSTIEADKRTDVVQKSQVSPIATKGKSTKESTPGKEKSSPQKTPPSPAL